MRHPLIIFDDGRGQLGPMTDLRASFEVRTGMFTTAGRIAAGPEHRLAGYRVPERLAALFAERANAPVNRLPDEEIVLCVNGRWGQPDLDLPVDVGEALVEDDSDHVIIALLRRADAEYFLDTGQLHEATRVRRAPERVLYRYPWDVLALIKETIPHDILSTRMLAARVITGGADVMGEHPVEVHESVTVGPQVVFDAGLGPIIVHEHAVLRPGAVLCGPCSVGRGSTVIDRALIKPYTVIGNDCKVGGEVGATIFQGCSNKSHEGHLGDSWVGKWVNFGAGTTGSNLMNTYTEVRMQVEADGPRRPTGLTFLGAIVGDHAKLAIGSRLMTGTVVGTGAMLALSAHLPVSIRRFAWLTDRGEQVHRLERLLDTVRAVMARRGRTPSPAYLEALRALHARAVERRAGGAPAASC